MSRNLIALWVGLMSFGGVVHSQPVPPHPTLFYNNGSIYVDSGAVLQIFGNTISTGPQSLLQNEGFIYVHFDTLFTTAQKGFTLNNLTVVTGNGYYEIEPDWTNNSPNFVPSQSHVNLMSDIQQLITGTSPTSFYVLELSGDGIGNDKKKRMTINASVLDSLSLNNRELATDSFVMTVLNTETTAISRDPSTANFGFVSSLEGDALKGMLVRRMSNSQNAYNFPVGSSTKPTVLYRPVDMLPVTNSVNSFGVRLINDSPDLKGYDQFSLGDSVCTVNPLWYHMVNRVTGQDASRIRISYDPLQDDIYDYISQWSNGKWDLIASSQLATGNPYSVFAPGIEIFSGDTLPFILADKRPGKGAILGSPDVCSGDLAMLRAAGNAKFYYWTVPGDMTILSEAGNDTLILQSGSTSGYIQMSSSSATGKCVEASDSFLLEVHPGPQANFTADVYTAFTKQQIEFHDSTLGSPVVWYWLFGDGNNASTPIVRHKFENVGQYVVEMYVRDENGCIDSIFRVIDIIEGIKVPNVFTPNGDGNNDVFYIPNSGMKEYHFSVFNRWGLIIFETTAPEIAWDGYSNTGERVSEGTYFYSLNARGEESDYSTSGFLTLFR